MLIYISGYPVLQLLQAIAKRVETLTVKHPIMRDIIVIRSGNRVLGGRDEISTECLNFFATACLIVLPQYCWMAYLFFGSRPCIYISFIVSFHDNFV